MQTDFYLPQIFAYNLVISNDSFVISPTYRFSQNLFTTHYVLIGSDNFNNSMFSIYSKEKKTTQSTLMR